MQRRRHFCCLGRQIFLFSKSVKISQKLSFLDLIDARFKQKCRSDWFTPTARSGTFVSWAAAIEHFSKNAYLLASLEFVDGTIFPDYSRGFPPGSPISFLL